MIRDEIKKILNMPEARISRPEIIEFGDYSTNVVLQLAKIKKKDPLALAEEIKREIESKAKSKELFDKIEIAPPGFINFWLAKEFLQKQIKEIIDQAENYGNLSIGQNKKAQVEFISANPTGPLTIGNSRGGVIGDVLANILEKAGWRVTREYYFNDAGGQIDALGHSVLKDDQAQYQGEYINKLHNELGTGDYKEIGKKAAKILIEQIKETTKKMGINFDVWFTEGEDLREKDKVKEIIEWLKEKDLTYEREGALWFKSTLFGDDKDRVLIRSNNEPTYFAVDCAYHKNKFVDRKFDRVINVWGADHHGDVPRLKGFIKALGYEDRFDIILHQFVRLLKNGKEVRMSKRAGNYVAVDDLLEEVGRDVYRFFMLQHSANTHMDFNLDLAKERSEKNPVFYVQYAYARISSILRKAQNKLQSSTYNFRLITSPFELTLVKQLIRLPEIIEDTATDYQVHRLPQFALELVRAFHKFYENCRVIDEKNPSLTQARLGLVKATKIVLKNTLDLMGISAPEKM